MLVVLALALAAQASDPSSPVVAADPAASVVDVTPAPPPPPTSSISPPSTSPPSTAEATFAKQKAEDDARARDQQVTGVVAGVAVANAASYVVLMGAGITTTLAIGPIAPEVAWIGLALPVVGVPLTVIITAAMLAPEGEMLKTITGTTVGHYGGLVLGTLGGALVGAGAGAVLILPLLLDGPGSNPAAGLALLAVPLLGGLGGLVGAGVGGTVGSGAGAQVALSFE